jgi:hypothetical protein
MLYNIVFLLTHTVGTTVPSRNDQGSKSIKESCITYIVTNWSYLTVAIVQFCWRSGIVLTGILSLEETLLETNFYADYVYPSVDGDLLSVLLYS